MRREVKGMYETLKRLYHSGRLGDGQLSAAVTKGWITANQAEEIKEGE